MTQCITVTNLRNLHAFMELKAQRDELAAALRNISEAVQYGIRCADVRAECGEIARAALAKLDGNKG